jgi:hypothetical protein
VQRPTLPGTSQASQGPVHEASQQTPSVQWPDAHSAAEVHAVPPAVFATQLPNWHRYPVLQSASASHVASQALEPLQVPAPHSEDGSTKSEKAVQLPAEAGPSHASHVPSHTPVQQTPSTQYPDAQSTPVAQAWPGSRFGAHSPPRQALPASQSASTRQPDRQLPCPSQVKLPQPFSTSVPAGRAEQPPS